MDSDIETDDDAYFLDTEKSTGRPRSAEVREIANLATIWGIGHEECEAFSEDEATSEDRMSLEEVLQAARTLPPSSDAILEVSDPSTWTSVFTPIHLRPGDPEAVAVLASPSRWQQLFCEPALARKLVIHDLRPQPDVIGRMFEAVMVERQDWPDDLMLVLGSDGSVVRVRWT